MQFMTYEEWLKRNPNAKMVERECQNCDGNGYIRCDHCGSEWECEECKGEGTFLDAYEEYEWQRKVDEAKLKRALV